MPTTFGRCLHRRYLQRARPSPPPSHGPPRPPRPSAPAVRGENVIFDRARGHHFQRLGSVAPRPLDVNSRRAERGAGPTSTGRCLRRRYLQRTRPSPNPLARATVSAAPVGAGGSHVPLLLWTGHAQRPVLRHRQLVPPRLGHVRRSFRTGGPCAQNCRENLCILKAPGGTTSKGWEVGPPGPTSSTGASPWAQASQWWGYAPVFYTFPDCSVEGWSPVAAPRGTRRTSAKAVRAAVAVGTRLSRSLWGT